MLGAMSRFARRLPFSLRTSMLVLLALGLLVKPVVTAISEIHTANHPELATRGHPHEHGSEHQDDRGADHAQGAHGLMHQATGGAFDQASARFELPAAAGADVLLPTADHRPGSQLRLTSPFRPPIA